MAEITIDGKEYDIDELSEEAKAQILSIRFVDSELARIQGQAAALQTARLAYAKALKELLEGGEKSDDEEVSIEGLGDSLDFDN